MPPSYRLLLREEHHSGQLELWVKTDATTERPPRQVSLLDLVKRALLARQRDAPGGMTDQVEPSHNPTAPDRGA